MIPSELQTRNTLAGNHDIVSEGPSRTEQSPLTRSFRKEAVMRTKEERHAHLAERKTALQAKLAERRLNTYGPQFDELTAWVAEHKAGRIARCGNVNLFSDRIIRLPSMFSSCIAESFPLTGVSAAVDTAGGIYSKGTLGRSLVSLGTWQKKKDNRESWLIVDGPEFQWLISVAPGMATSGARRFAAQVTTLGRRS